MAGLGGQAQLDKIFFFLGEGVHGQAQGFFNARNGGLRQRRDRCEAGDEGAGKGDGERVLRALTLRVSLSLVLFVGLLLAWRFGGYSQ